MFLTFLVHEYTGTFKSIFPPNKIFKRNLAKNLRYLAQDPDPEPDTDVFKSGTRIRSKIVRIRNTSSKSHVITERTFITFI
jgi:hypothetical protein